MCAASLTVVGTDSLGFQLIYDPNLDVTWYDCCAIGKGWTGSVDWAAQLTVNFKGASIGGWALPDAGNLPKSPAGPNPPYSALKYLYAVELGNSPGSDPFNQAPFQNLLADWLKKSRPGIPPPLAFWTGTRFGDESPAYAWDINFLTGSQVVNASGESDVPYAIALHAGDIRILPPSGPIIVISTPP